jgi:hypothetical protein
MNNSKKNNESFGGGVVDMNNFDNSLPNIENQNNNMSANLYPDEIIEVKQENKNKKFIISVSILIIIVILGLSICLSLYTKKTDKK